MSIEMTVDDFESLLPTRCEPASHVEARIENLGQRRKSSKALSTALDRFLIERYMKLLARHTELKGRFDEVQAIQGELREMLAEATAPPWFAGMYLRMVQTPSGPLADVFQGGARRLVHLGGNVSAENLSPGQVVYLGHELNAVLGLGPTDAPEAGETAIVERVLPDGRLALLDHDAQVLVHATPAVRESRVSAGDSVRWSREIMLALEPVQGNAPNEVFATEYLYAQPQQQLGGLALETAQVISLFTESIAHPEAANRYGLTHGNTLLLHGPPGNGKTSLARIVGSALAATTGKKCRFASVKGAQLESPWVGTSQRNVRELFRELTRDPRPAVLFIDEVDAIGRIRGVTSGHHSDKFLSAWLTEIDGLERHQPVGIIASTNRKDLIDQALLDRISGMELFIGRPGREMAREILSIHLPPNLPFGPNGTEAERTREEIVNAAVDTLYSPNADNAIAELRFRDGSARTVSARDILSGRTIEQICVHARRSAFTRDARGGASGVQVADMEEAVAQALERLASTLSIANARALLSDLPQDLDVVAVKPLHRKIARHRYSHPPAHV